MILALIDEAIAAGARLKPTCELLGLTVRATQRWRRGTGEDLRCGPRLEPANKLSAEERHHMLDVANSLEYRDLPPAQIVPRLADTGVYLASESSFHRVLRAADQLKHRAPSRPRTPRTPPRLVATGADQVWSWDITYLRAAIRGTFYRLYLIVDIWSRKVVGWAVHETETPELAAELFERTCRELGLDPAGLVLHSDNGGPMKGSTMLATLQRLGVIASFSRPRVSDDNAYSEALFRTLKYRPGYPTKPFASLEEADAWVAGFVHWYNTDHLHSGVSFVRPADRHAGRDVEILAKRHRVYAQARARRPDRWSGNVRDWSRVETVHLNPIEETKAALQ